MWRNLACFSYETWVGRMIRLPLRLVPAGIILPVLSGVNKRMKWVSGSATHGAWLGSYEHDKQDAIKRLVKPGMTVFDVGANAGFYTLAFSRLVGSSGRVIAFEPLAENVANLRRHVLLNQLSNVTVIQAAVSDKPGLASFCAGHNNAVGRLSQDPGEYLVPTVTLSQLVNESTIPAPDLVKMDVEGAESVVLVGAQSLLARRHTLWLIALHGREQAQLCQAMLRDAKYSVLTLDQASVLTDREVDEIYAVAIKEAEA